MRRSLPTSALRSLLCAALGCAALAHAADAPAPAATAAPVCSATIEGQPGKKFDMTELRVSRRCDTFTVHLVHTGKKPWREAGHNWVLVRSADIDGVIADGLRAGDSHAWVPPNDARVIAATQMLSGGEHAQVQFPTARLRPGEAYTYLCTFPSHALPMRGRLVLVD